MNYYNENDPRAAAWLRELIAKDLIPLGFVDERSIHDVRPRDLRGYRQCHFFAGIGGWSLALRLAGVADDEPLYTGSCPCQPFSQAGKNKGEKDPRHLWPVWLPLIRERGPAVILGEQVASPAGRRWLSRVFADLEGMGYAVAGADLCAAGVGAPHIRQRLFWVADAQCDPESRRAADLCGERTQATGKRPSIQSGRRGLSGRLADTDQHQPRARRAAGCQGEARDESGPQPGGCGAAGRLAHSALPEGSRLGQQREQLHGPAAWSDFDLILCADGKTRRIESGTFPLAHGVPGRVGLLRGYGNAIVPELAAQFIRAAQPQICRP